MSQFPQPPSPPPYQPPPPPGFGPPPAGPMGLQHAPLFGPPPVHLIPPPGAEEPLLEPARRGARLMSFLAALAGLVAVFIFASIAFMPIEEIIRNPQPGTEAVWKQMQDRLPPGQTIEKQIRIQLALMGTMAALAALAVYVASLFTRSGGVAATTVAIVLVGILLLGLLMMTLGMGMFDGGVMILAGMFLALPLMLAVRTLRWLFMATKLASQIDRIRQLQQMRLLVWQHYLPPDAGDDRSSRNRAPPAYRPPAAMAGPFAPFAISGGFGYAQPSQGVTSLQDGPPPSASNDGPPGKE